MSKKVETKATDSAAANAAAVLKIRGTLSAPVGAYVKAEVSFTLASNTIVDDVARALGSNPTFDHWNLVSAAFRDEYKAARLQAGNAITDERAANVWSGITGQLETKYELKKPAKATQESKKKAAQRAKSDKAIKAVKAQCTNSADAMNKAAKLAQEGKANEAKLYREASIQLHKEESEKAAKIGKEKLAKLKDELRDLIKACEDEKQLRDAIAYLKLDRKVGKTKPAPKVVKAKKEKAAA